MKSVFNIYDNIISKMKKWNLEKIYAVGLLGILCILIFPMLWLSIYNVPNAGDDIAHTMGPHLAWMADHSIGGFFATVGAAWDRMIEIYMGWGGNYTSFFFSALQPVVFSEKLAFVGTFLFVFGLALGEYKLLKEMLVYYFQLSKHVLIIAFAGIMILNTQYLTSARQAFYWYSGCVTNTLGFAASLWLLSILLRSYREKSMKTGSFVGSVFLAVFIAGCNYSSLVSLLVILLFFYMSVIANKDIMKVDKVKMFTILAVLLIGMAISIVAPGNTIRQQYNDGSNAIIAVMNAILQGRALAIGYLNSKVIALTILIVPFIWNQLDEKKEYRLPLLLLIISCGIFCAALTPTMKSDSTYGPRRTRNLYWWMFLNLYFMNLVYCLGWLKKFVTTKFSKIDWKFQKEHQLGMMAVVLLLLCFTTQIEDIKTIPFTQATLDLVSGRAQRFGQQMEDRYQEYYSEEKDITVHYVEYIPQLFIEEQNDIYANNLGTTTTGEYYGKDSITVVE